MYLELAVSQFVQIKLSGEWDWTMKSCIQLQKRQNKLVSKWS